MIKNVYTAREAEKLWGLATNTVAKWCQRGRFNNDEFRKSEKTWLVTKNGMNRLAGIKFEEENKVENIQEVLKGWFKFKQYAGFAKSTAGGDDEEFENNLKEFGAFKVYDNFKAILLDNDIYLEDEDGNLMNVDEILDNENSYNEFVENKMYMDNFNELTFVNINKPIIFGEANIQDNPIHLISIDELKRESDLITFINDVLRDINEVDHSSGTRAEYEVIRIVE